MRTLSFIQFDVPGFPPYSDFSKGSTLRPELWAAIGADRYFAPAHLTAGVVFGVQLPASMTAAALGLGGANPPAALLGQTLVARDVNAFTVLPAGYDVIPIVSVKGTFKIDISEYFAALGEVFYNFDANRVIFLQSTESISTPEFENEHQLGFNLVLQARF
jgi:hypothetical protein